MTEVNAEQYWIELALKERRANASGLLGFFAFISCACAVPFCYFFYLQLYDQMYDQRAQAVGTIVAAGLCVIFFFIAIAYKRLRLFVSMILRPTCKIKEIRQLSTCTLYDKHIQPTEYYRIRCFDRDFDEMIVVPWEWVGLLNLSGRRYPSGLEFKSARVAEVAGTGEEFYQSFGTGTGGYWFGDPKYILLEIGGLSVQKEFNAGLGLQIPRIGRGAGCFVYGSMGLFLAVFSPFMSDFADFPDYAVLLGTIVLGIVCSAAIAYGLLVCRQCDRRLGAVKQFYGVR